MLIWWYFCQFQLKKLKTNQKPRSKPTTTGMKKFPAGWCSSCFSADTWFSGDKIQAFSGHLVINARNLPSGSCVRHSYILHLCFSGRYTDFLGSVYVPVSAEVSKLHCGPNYPAVTTRLIPVPSLVWADQLPSPERMLRRKLLKTQKPLVSATLLCRVETQHSRAIQFQLLHFMEKFSGTKEKDCKGVLY